MIETLSNITSQRLKFSPRIFLFIVFGLAIIILSIELGYLIGVKSGPRGTTEVTQPSTSETSLQQTLQPETHVYGRVKEIDGKNLLLEEKSERFWLTLKDPIKVSIIKTGVSPEGVETRAGLADVEKKWKGLVAGTRFEGRLEDLRVGDLVFIGELVLDGKTEHLLVGSSVKIIRE